MYAKFAVKLMIFELFVIKSAFDCWRLLATHGRQPG
jgi:hypothetical protein